MICFIMFHVLRARTTFFEIHNSLNNILYREVSLSLYFNLLIIKRSTKNTITSDKTIAVITPFIPYNGIRIR